MNITKDNEQEQSLTEKEPVIRTVRQERIHVIPMKEVRDGDRIPVHIEVTRKAGAKPINFNPESHES